MPYLESFTRRKYSNLIFLFHNLTLAEEVVPAATWGSIVLCPTGVSGCPIESQACIKPRRQRCCTITLSSRVCALAKKSNMALKVLVLLTVAVLPVVFAVLPVDYVGLTGAAKRDVLWSRVNESPHAGKLPNSNPGPLSMANMFNPVFLVKTFNTESDEWDDPNHVKLIHTYGCK